MPADCEPVRRGAGAPYDVRTRPRVEFELLVEGFGGVGGEVCFAEVPNAWWKVGNVLGLTVGAAGIGGADAQGGSWVQCFSEAEYQMWWLAMGNARVQRCLARPIVAVGRAVHEGPGKARHGWMALLPMQNWVICKVAKCRLNI